MSSQIRDIVVRSAAQHGLGIYDCFGWLHHNEVDKASNDTPNTHDAVFVTDGNGSIIEDNLLPAEFARYGINWSDSSFVNIGGNKVGDPVTRDYNHGANTIWSRANSESLSRSGVLVAAVGSFRLPMSYDAKIISIRASVNVAPTGASIIIDVNKNTTSIFPTTTKPTIAVSTFMRQIAIPDTYEVAADDYLIVDIDQVGSTIAGSDLTVRVMMENER